MRFVPQTKFKNMRSLLIVPCLAAFCLAFSPVEAQHYKLFVYNELDGMQNTLVKAVEEDQFGLMWLATDGGLIRYDGNTFQSYQDQIPTPYIKDLLQLEGRILVSTDEGLYWLKPALQSAEIQPVAPDSGLRLTKKLFQDQAGQVWGSDNHRVFRLRGDDLTLYPFNEAYRSEDFTRSFSFFEDGWGQLYTVSKNGVLFAYREAEDGFSEPLYRFSTGVNDVARLRPGLVWVATYGGIYALHLSREGKVEKVEPASALSPIALRMTKRGQVIAAVRNQGLFRVAPDGGGQPLQPDDWPVTSFSSLFESHSGNLWAGTDDGLLLLKPKSFTTAFPKQLKRHYIQSIAPYANKVYISDGGLIFQTKAEEGATQLVRFFKPPFEVFALEATAKGLWMGGADGRLILVNWKQRVARTHDLSAYGQEIFNLESDDDGQLWVCQAQAEGVLRVAANGEVKQYASLQGLFVKAAEAVHFDRRNGQLYVGGVQAERPLFRYNSSLDRFEGLFADLPVDKQQDFRIIDMASGREGEIILGASLGLFRFDGETVRPVRPEWTNGVNVSAVVVEAGGPIWFATANGLGLLEDSIRLTYTPMHGLPSKLINWRCIALDSSGQLWAGTPEGLAYFNGHSISKTTDQPLLVSTASSKGVDYRPAKRRFIADMDDYLSVHYLSVGYPSTLTEYRIEVSSAEDSTYVIHTRDNELSFLSLDRGDMAVRIQGRQSSAHYWSPPLEFFLEVHPVWYKSWYGILGIILFLGFVAFLVNLIRQDHFERQSKRLSEYNQQLEEQVQAGIQDYQLLVNYIGDSVLKVNAEGEVLYTSPSWLDNYGYSSEETVGHRLTLFLHPDDIDKTLAELSALHGENRSSFELEHRFKHRNGEWRWVETKAELEPNAGEVVLISRDITERKNSAEQLESFAAMQKILMDISSKYINLPLRELEPAINVSLKQMGEFVEADRVYIFDYHFEQEICTNTYEWCREGITPEIENLQAVPLEVLTDWVNTHIKGLPMYIPDVFSLPESDGTRQVVEPQGIKSLLAVPLMNADQCIGFVGFDSVRTWHRYTQREITLLKVFGQLLVNIRMRTQKQLELQQLLETATDQNERLKEFSFMTSHNIRASVANLLALTEMIKAEPDNPEYFEMMEATTQKLDTTIANINHLLNFEKEINQQDKKPCNLSETVHRVIGLNNQIIKERRVSVEVDVSQDLWIKAIPAHLDSIFHNLLTNAIKYGTTEQSKVIEIRARTNRDTVVAEVQDYGLGIDLERFRDKLFQLGSRLHVSSAEGQGLGLYMTKNQVEGLGGQITVRSEVGKGALFRVELPRLEPEAMLPNPSPADAEGEHSGDPAANG